MYLAWDSQPARLTLSPFVNDPCMKATSEDGQRDVYTEREFVYTLSKIEGEVGWETTDRQSIEACCVSQQGTRQYPACQI